MFNLRSPDATAAPWQAAVRQAIEYGIDKIGRPEGRTAARRSRKVINTVIPPGNIGYAEHQPVPDDNGRATRPSASPLLAKAGYPNGLTLTYLYPNDSVNTAVFQAIQASLAQLRHHAERQARAGLQLLHRPGQRAGEQQGRHVGHGPGRLDPRLVRQQRPHRSSSRCSRPNCVLNTVNYGCYSSKQRGQPDHHRPRRRTTRQRGRDAVAPGRRTTSCSDAVIVPAAEPELPDVLQHADVEQRGHDRRWCRRTSADPDITNIWLKNGWLTASSE